MTAIDLPKCAPLVKKQAVSGRLLLRLYKKNQMQTIWENLELQGLQRQRLEEELEDIITG